MFTVYILKSLKDLKRYIGLTENLERRIKEHNTGLVKSTKSRRPLELIHIEGFENKIEAQNREKFYKTGAGREYLKKLNL
ncbi:MAG: GIY-YIG nuclease family protein [Ignavibacteria bacterium]|nr:GIY-YIG nuclease family protein [Ignavibacteria bacterium]